MSDPFIGEIQAFPFAFAASGFNGGTWAPCFGQVITISSNPTLYSLLGTYYGGNGTTNFGLPNLNGRIAMSQGQGNGLQPRTIGETLGSPVVSLTGDQMAVHTHGMQLGAKGATNGTAGPGTASTTAAIDPNINGFVAPPTGLTLAANAVGMTGQGQTHDNNQPTQALVWCIALRGILPVFSS